MEIRGPLAATFALEVRPWSCLQHRPDGAVEAPQVTDRTCVTAERRRRRPVAGLEDGTACYPVPPETCAERHTGEVLHLLCTITARILPCSVRLPLAKIGIVHPLNGHGSVAGVVPALAAANYVRERGEPR